MMKKIASIRAQKIAARQLAAIYTWRPSGPAK